MLTVILPCRKGSTRLGFDKQLSPFCGTTLLDIKVKQLQDCKFIDRIILSTNDDRIFGRYQNVEVYQRDINLISTDGNVFVEICKQHVQEGDVLITMCTAPFFKEYDNAIKKYYSTDCDCLLTGRKINSFVVSKNNIINKTNNDVWPQTQTLQTWFELDNGISPIMNIDMMKKYDSRIGIHPYIYTTDIIQSIDIDYKEQWDLAEKLWNTF